MLEPSLDPQLLKTQLDFFHKLGYSTAQVRAVQQKFGTDTDKVLGELVRIGASRESKKGPATTVSVLVPRRDPRAAGPDLLLPVTESPGSREDNGGHGDALRSVVIDGSNVAMSHGNKEVFSCLGIQLAVNFFLDRGHADVTVFVPSWRKEQPRPDVPITGQIRLLGKTIMLQWLPGRLERKFENMGMFQWPDKIQQKRISETCCCRRFYKLLDYQHILRDLEKKKVLVFTPSRRVAGKRVVCNDDCFIVKHAFESDGIIVSNDMYRDLQGVKPEWKRFIEERLLMFSFVNNKFMPPDDPLGRHGPTLENFLRKFPKTQKKQMCPYGKKCTYGIKCRFYHPERTKPSNRLVANELRQNSKTPPTSQKQASARGGSVPELGLPLVEDMAKNLMLGQESCSSRKDERAVQVKSGHRSSKKIQTKREKISRQLDHSWTLDRRALDQLDSGLGSIDSQSTEAAWSLCDQQYGPSYGSMRSQYCPPRSAPCSCCSHALFQPPNIVPGSSQNPDLTGYSLPRHPSCYVYPVNRPPYSQPADFQPSRVQPHLQPLHWSDPLTTGPPEASGRPGEGSQWEPDTAPGRKERDVVRKKLLAIFSAQLVDTTMNMFPDVMDPQRLVAEILILQSQSLK